MASMDRLEMWAVRERAAKDRDFDLRNLAEKALDDGDGSEAWAAVEAREGERFREMMANG